MWPGRAQLTILSYSWLNIAHIRFHGKNDALPYVWLQLAEQQAFERSRRFLRQLECTFGEQSDLYRKVVHILQGGPSQDLPDIKEVFKIGTSSVSFLFWHSNTSYLFSQMKAQIRLLFRDHTDLLEEFWEFFKQLYPQVQDEDHADSVETIQGLEGNHACQPIRTVLPDKKMEPVKTAVKHRRKSDKHVQVSHEENFSYVVSVYKDPKSSELYAYHISVR